MAVSAQEQRAQAFMQQGDAALKRFSIFSSASKYEDAVDNFQKAANCFKVAKKWQEAGDAFARCADCQTHLKSTHEAATFYVDAANCYKKVLPAEAINYFGSAIALYCELGRFSTAAKHQQAVAELHEEDGEIQAAIDNFQQASDYFLGEDAKSKSNQCLLKVATLSTDEKVKEYDRAIEIYESVAESCLESNLLKFNAKGYFLQAGICVLCKGDTVAMRQKLEQYKEKDYTFADCRECKFVEDLTQDYEDYNIDDFTEHVYAYDNISKLDAWKTSMLLRIKKQIEATGDEAVDLT